MNENFADYPQTIGEIASDKEFDSRKWTLRDALIAVLRDVDSGKLEIAHGIIAFKTADNKLRWFIAGASVTETLGLLEYTKHDIFMADN